MQQLTLDCFHKHVFYRTKAIIIIKMRILECRIQHWKEEFSMKLLRRYVQLTRQEI